MEAAAVQEAERRTSYLELFFDLVFVFAFWCTGLAVDVLGTLRAGENAGFRVSPDHFAERYALFIIIALGESIVAIGSGLAGHTRDAAFAL